MAQGHDMRCFGPFGTRIYIISTSFLGSKSSKKDKNIISCTGLYVDHIEALIGQSREGRLLKTQMDLQDKMQWKI